MGPTVLQCVDREVGTEINKAPNGKKRNTTKIPKTQRGPRFQQSMLSQSSKNTDENDAKWKLSFCQEDDEVSFRTEFTSGTG